MSKAENRQDRPMTSALETRDRAVSVTLRCAQCGGLVAANENHVCPLSKEIDDANRQPEQ
jgi:hypothetical protein